MSENIFDFHDAIRSELKKRVYENHQLQLVEWPSGKSLIICSCGVTIAEQLSSSAAIVAWQNRDKFAKHLQAAMQTEADSIKANVDSAAYNNDLVKAIKQRSVDDCELFKDLGEYRAEGLWG